MFEGRSVSLRQVSRNQFEYKTPFTVVRRTAQEIEALIEEERSTARRMLMETTLAKQALLGLSQASPAAPVAPKPSTPPPAVLPTPIADPTPSLPKPVVTEVEVVQAVAEPAPVKAAPKPRIKKPKPVVIEAKHDVAIEAVSIADVPMPEPANDVEPEVVQRIPSTAAQKRPQGRAYIAWLAQQRAS